MCCLFPVPCSSPSANEQLARGDLRTNRVCMLSTPRNPSPYRPQRDPAFHFRWMHYVLLHPTLFRHYAGVVLPMFRALIIYSALPCLTAPFPTPTPTHAVIEINSISATILRRTIRNISAVRKPTPQLIPRHPGIFKRQPDAIHMQRWCKGRRVRVRRGRLLRVRRVDIVTHAAAMAASTTQMSPR